MPLDSIGSPALWAGFIAFVTAMLALDLGLFHKEAHEVSMKEAAGWSIVWVILAALFGGIVAWQFGPERAMEFGAGYLIEKALAVDNIFVFVLIFSAFAIPTKYQHRVLFWGVFGALVMRAIFIFAGAAFLERFHWAIYVFGGILIATGVKLLVQKEGAMDPEQNFAIRAMRRFMPVTSQFDGDRFTTRIDGRTFATPMMLALVSVEVTDLIFAVDSIPAIFAVTRDPFIVFTSNIFAILGLRSLYFLLAGVVQKFHYLKVGLSFILVFVGAKMVAIEWVKVPIWLSLTIIGLILAVAMVASWWRERRASAA